MDAEGRSRPIVYREIAPSAELADYVQCLWTFRASNGLDGVFEHHVVPDGCVGLVQRRVGPSGLGPLLVMGPRVVVTRVEIRGGDEYCGVRFRPEGAGLLLRCDPGSLRDRVEPLAMHAPGLARRLEAMIGAAEGVEVTATMMERILVEVASECPAPDPVVRRAVEAIVALGGCEPIRSVASRLGVGERQLQRRFRRAVGLTPKQFARVRRLRTALSEALAMGPGGWVGVAMEHGYADQAHLSREVARLTGLTPSRFRALHELIALEDVDP